MIGQTTWTLCMFLDFFINIYMIPLHECYNCTSLIRLIHECTDINSIILQLSFEMFCLRLIVCGFMDSKLTNFTYICVWILMLYLCLIQTLWVLQSYAFDQDKMSIHVLSIPKGYYTVWSQVFITYCVVCTTTYWQTVYIFFRLL